ncbi:hypothetical protein [Streptobacillus canis]|uniref:hypothetical protein n=1 Tax=Streptobacillus canis TaxID=2678686 RepID=UPI0012E27B8C|nr:hypothetical protein [Streptobacillus canis]
MKKKYWLFLFLINTFLLNAAQKHVSTPEQFMEAVKNSNSNDEIILDNDIRILTENSETSYKFNESVVNRYSSLYFNGSTINGNNHTLEVLGWNFSLINSTTFKNINLELTPVNATTPSIEANDLTKSSIIFANGYDLTFENVSTNHSPSNPASKNNKPVIIMGNAKVLENINPDSDESNTLNIIGDKKIEFKTIIAGSESGEKKGKTTLNISSNTNITSNKGTILLKNFDNTGKIDIELNNKGNSNIKTYDISNNDNGNVIININDANYNETNGVTEFKGKVDELNLSGSTKLFIDKSLEVENLNLKSGTPALKILKSDGLDDDYIIVPAKEGSLSATTINSENPEAKIEISDNRVNKSPDVITAKNVTGKFIFTNNGNKNAFPNYTNDNNPSSSSSTDTTTNNDLIEDKNRIKEELKTKTSLTNEQVGKFKEKIDSALNQEELTRISNDINNLNQLMQEVLTDKVTVLANKENKNYNQISENLKTKLEDLVIKVNEAITDTNIEKLENLSSEMKYIDSKVKEEIKKIEDKKIDEEEKVNLSQYTENARAFIFNDIDIAKSFEEKSYFNLGVGKGVTNNLGLIAKVNAGFNIDVIKDIKVGGFLEYNKDIAHHFSIGTNFKHKDGLSFIRYRLAIYNKMFNHNIDIYGKYMKEINILKDLTVTPSIGLYLSYSNKVELDKKVMLNQRFIALGDLEAKLNYHIYGIDFYISPLLKFGYNGAILLEKANQKNKLNIGRDYFVYGLNAGLNKSFDNGVVLKFNLGANSNEKLDVKLKSDLGIAYNW